MGVLECLVVELVLVEEECVDGGGEEFEVEE